MAPASKDAETLALLQSAGTNGGKRILLRGGVLLSMDEKVGHHQSADVLIEGETIEAIAPNIDVNPGNAIVVDASNTIVMPGLIDAHRHAWQSALRGLIPASSRHEYRALVHPKLAPNYTPEDMRIGNLATSLGCIEGGITCIIDNSHNARSAEHSDGAIEGLLEAGIRAVHASGKPMDANAGGGEQWPADIGRLRKRYFSSEDQLLTLRLYSLLEQEAVDYARDNDLRLTAEFSDWLADRLDARIAENPELPIITYNHCTGLSEKTWTQIRDTGGNVNVCPRADARFWITHQPLPTAIEHGFRPGMSVDHEIVYSTSMFTEMNFAMIMQRAVVLSQQGTEGDPARTPLPPRTILECATVNNAECAGLADRIGSLTAGKQADIILVRTDGMEIFPVNNAYGAVTTSANIGNVDTVFIAGKVRKFRGELLDVDFPRVRRELLSSREGIFARAGFQLDMFRD